MQVVLFDIRQQQSGPAPTRIGLRGNVGTGQFPNVTGRKAVIIAMIEVKGDADLMEIVLALDPVGGLAGFLHGRQ